jgi:ABC-type sugar transport system ATPase subunit
MEVQLENVENSICKGISLKVKSGEILVIAGRTGAGKTTLLNIIAGLIPYKGRILFDGKVADHLPPEKRQIGYVFQNQLLFPHMKVWENVAFPLKVKGFKGEALKEKVKEALQMMGIGELWDRYPSTLSGGEAQRVALARAIIGMPKLLLLDEPFSKVDLGTAKRLRLHLKKIQREMGITTLFVTHNLQEAFEMGDRIALLEEGRIQQIGTPEELLFSPANCSVSSYFGNPNVFWCLGQKGLSIGVAQADLGSFSLIVPWSGKRILKVAFFPWNVYLSPDPPPGPKVNRFKGRIEEIERVSSLTKVKVQIGKSLITVDMEESNLREMELREGKEVYVIIPLRWIKTFEVEDGV